MAATAAAIWLGCFAGLSVPPVRSSMPAPGQELTAPAPLATPGSVPALSASVVLGALADLQPAPEVAAVTIGQVSEMRAILVDPAPRSGAWYLLQIVPAHGPPVIYHLGTLEPRRSHVELVADGGGALRLTIDGRATVCAPWTGGANSELARARSSGLPYAPLCEGRLHLRNPSAGRRSNLERVTDFLRDRVRGGETLTRFVKDTLFKDRYLRTASAEVAAGEYREPPGAPPPLAIAPRHAGATVAPDGLALALDGVEGGKLEVGRWYPATGIPEVFASAVQAGQVVGLGEALQGTASPLDEVETTALTYLVAFDLSRLELGFALGTDHPRLGWSERVPEPMRDDALPGPDGVGDSAPLVRTGVLAPQLAASVVSTFTGGFKRAHGAFKYGTLAYRNSGSHYGFVEQGVVLSRPQPGVATVMVWVDGRVELVTWRRELDARLADVRHVRQNGVALVEPGADGRPRPGALVTRWGQGNWSGSEEKNLRTLRAGVCEIDAAAGHFLVYGYFSGATPSAMARVFLAAGCRYALHLDMNALEHTYLALYRTEPGRFLTEHLIDGMAVLDPEKNGTQLPRFVAVADNRDFFYLSRRTEEPR